MKKRLILAFATVAFLADSSVAQKTKTLRAFEPARGHYKQLSALSSSPQSKGMEIDNVRFLTNQETVERRLSLKPIYLEHVTVDDFNIPSVPANSSAQTKAEIDYLLAIQRTRTDEDVRTSLYMADVYYNLRVKEGDPTYKRFRSNIFFVGRSIGSWFNYENLPVTADLMARVWQDASYFIWALKFKYARVRPVVVDARIKNLQETDWAAYPSGHASNSYINALIYSELAPEFTDFFMKDAYDMAHSREILGVHYPSDSESGRIFAHQFVTMLFQDPKFLSDFQKVKEEWAAKAKETFE